jgi:hypothetical protein
MLTSRAYLNNKLLITILNYPLIKISPMKNIFNIYLITSGFVTLAGGVLHILLIFGGPAWYARFGAPDSIIRMVKNGDFYPNFVCLLTAAFLFICSAYAFSGVKIILHLPFLKTILMLIGFFFVARGVIFIPLMAIRPELMANICNSKGIDTFLVVTSLLCLLTGIGYSMGSINAEPWENMITLPD